MPFSFPYAATIELILVHHALVTPVVIMNLLSDEGSGTPFLPIPWVAIVVFFLWSLHFIAGELENPCDGDKNDIDLQGLQDDLNEKLNAISAVNYSDVPFLVATVAESTRWLRAHRSNRTESNAWRNMLQRSDQISLETFVAETDDGSLCDYGDVFDGSEMHKSISFHETVNSSVSTVRHVPSDLTRRYSDASSMQEGGKGSEESKCSEEGCSTEISQADLPPIPQELHVHRHPIGNMGEHTLRLPVRGCVTIPTFRSKG